MVTPIRPSLSQVLRPASNPAQNPTIGIAQAPSRPQAAPATDIDALRRAFFSKTPAITPPTYTAAEIARATTPAAPSLPASLPQGGAPETPGRLLRPGSVLNIVV